MDIPTQSQVATIPDIVLNPEALLHLAMLHITALKDQYKDGVLAKHHIKAALEFLAGTREVNDSVPEEKIESTPEAWEEGPLGKDEAYVASAEPEVSVAVDEALDLELVQLRLDKKTLETIDQLAKGAGLIRVAMIREMLNIYIDYLSGICAGDPEHFKKSDKVEENEFVKALENGFPDTKA